MLDVGFSNSSWSLMNSPRDRLSLSVIFDTDARGRRNDTAEIRRLSDERVYER
jgi:hypothetical protein